MQAGGSMASSGLNFMSAKQGQDFAEDFAKKKFRWAVKDMRKAGLNPALMFGSGSPGSAPHFPVAQFENPFEGAAQTGREYETRAAEAAKKRAEATDIVPATKKLLDQQFNVATAQEARELTQADLNVATQAKSAADAAASIASARKMDMEMEKVKAQLPGERALGAFYDTTVGGAARVLQQIVPSGSALADTLDALTRGRGKGKGATPVAPRGSRTPSTMHKGR